jgi:cell wall-associated NlpC family hydrolase
MGWSVRTCATAAAVAALTVGVAAGGAGAATLGGWSRTQQKQVVRAGAMAVFPSDHRFHGERRLSVAQLRSTLGVLAARDGVDRVPLPGAGTVTVARFDRLLVQQLGLEDVATHVQQEARAAGLKPPARFGDEVTARQLGLRYNHPSWDDRLELFPTDAITRAEAAWSVAQVLRLSDDDIAYVTDQLSGFTLPTTYDAAQRRILGLAVSRIGWPYIWGGESDGTFSSAGGWQAHGGFDCSGLVWRVFKLSGSPWGHLIQGRTAAQQAGEVSRARRLHLRQLRGGDLLFFGTARFTSTPTEANVVHEGIALTKDWMIQSSSQGVYLGSLREPWRRDEFAWGRRVL